MRRETWRRRLAFGALLLAGCAADEEAEPERPEFARAETPAYARRSDTPSPPAVPFTDVATVAGLDFTHVTGAFGDKWMPETMGSGAGFFDADGDGDDDVVLVNGTWWPGHEGDGAAPTSGLFANNGAGVFADVTAGSGLDTSVAGMGVTAADYDADGDIDLYLTTLGPNLLLRREAGLHYAEVGAVAGVAGVPWTDDTGRPHPEWSTGAAWADVDNDGWLDLLVTNYVRWSPENDLYFSFDGKGKSYATPQQYPGSTPRLYRNVGGGSFTEVTETAGVYLPHAKSMGVAPADLDGDGWVDLLITNDTQPNFLLHNRGDGRFEEAGLAAGIGYDESGRARAGMGVDVADLADDGVLAIGIGNFSREALSLYRQTAPGAAVFVDGAGKSRLVQSTLTMLTFGLKFLDYDLDGRLDLMLVNGHIEPEISAVQKEIRYAQPPQLFWNDGEGHLIEAGAAAGAAFAEPLVGRGLAIGDLEGDGDPDALITANGGRPRLLRNDGGSAAGRALVLALRGRAPNRDALGARVTVIVAGRARAAQMRSGSSYLSQHAARLTFGLGDAWRADEVTVRWPDRTHETFGALAPGHHTLEQGAGQAPQAAR